MSKSVMEILKGAEKADIIAVDEEGRKYVNSEDYYNLILADQINKEPKLGTVEFNPDGSPAGTAAPYLCISPEQVFLNRYKLIDESTIGVVTDWWSITQQQTGRIPFSQVPCFIVVRDGKALKLDKTVTISDREFLAEYTESLDRESMSKILPLLGHTDGITKNKLPI